MTQIEKFNDTVSILVKAYFNGTLQHSNCNACAVGNIVANKIGVELINDRNYIYWKNDFPHWYNACWLGHLRRHEVTPEAQRQYDATGYTGEQLAEIEYAFEFVKDNSNHDNDLDPEWMFNGLMSVVDKLAEIHGIDLEKKESAKLLFVK